MSKATNHDLEALTRAARANPDAFWDEVADRLDWIERWTKTRDVDLNDPVLVTWFKDGRLNAAYNCVDRHLPEHADRVAFYFEPEAVDGERRRITYGELARESSRLANGLKRLGVKPGDRVTLYLPMIPETIFAMLACARLGAPHSLVFAGFSPEALRDRVLDAGSSFVITADGGWRGGRELPLKANADRALVNVPAVRAIVVVKRTGRDAPMTAGRDHWYDDVTLHQSTTCEPYAADSEHPLFLLYTSGSTNKPKGVLHTTGGYLAYAAWTHDLVFAHSPDQVYWCAADVGWVTGHSYIVYGPLANGATSVLFEGQPTYPDAGRTWEIVDRYGVNILYTAPTLLRALMGLGDDFVRRAKRTSLRVLGSVGEPINPEAWAWYNEVVGDGRCPIVDTWWQTETGGILISPVAHQSRLKPGSAGFALPGITPVLVNERGERLAGAAEGHLCIEGSWPGQIRSIYGDHARLFDTYYRQYPGLYFTGDGARRDEDGFFWITGRVDDVLNVSGHRIGTAEIEGALAKHHAVTEAAVVGVPHAVKGQGIYAFVTLKHDAAPSDRLATELKDLVRTEIGGLAKPDWIQWAPALPKTRSGKIMRRILRKIAAGEVDQLGDTSTLADPAVVTDLLSHRVSG